VLIPVRPIIHVYVFATNCNGSLRSGSHEIFIVQCCTHIIMPAPSKPGDCSSVHSRAGQTHTGNTRGPNLDSIHATQVTLPVINKHIPLQDCLSTSSWWQDKPDLAMSSRLPVGTDSIHQNARDQANLPHRRAKGHPQQAKNAGMLQCQCGRLARRWDFTACHCCCKNILSHHHQLHRRYPPMHRLSWLEGHTRNDRSQPCTPSRVPMCNTLLCPTPMLLH
jgi:hypothetical protein